MAAILKQNKNHRRLLIPIDITTAILYYITVIRHHLVRWHVDRVLINMMYLVSTWSFTKNSFLVFRIVTVQLK